MKKLGSLFLLATILSIPSVSAKEKREGNDQSDGKNSRGKCEKAEYCDDKDFSPSFDESPVIVCLPSSTCNFTTTSLPPAVVCAPYHCDPKPE